MINCINHPASNISQFIDHILQPHVRLSKSFIKDSQHLIQKLKSLPIPKEKFRLSFLDFGSPYSIDIDNAFFVIVDFMKVKISNQHIAIAGFYNLLKLLFEKPKVLPWARNVALRQLTYTFHDNEESFIVIHKPLFHVILTIFFSSLLCSHKY